MSAQICSYIPYSEDIQRNNQLTLLKSWNNALTPDRANWLYENCVKTNFDERRFANGGRGRNDMLWFYDEQHNLNIIDRHNYTAFQDRFHTLFSKPRIVGGYVMRYELESENDIIEVTADNGDKWYAVCIYYTKDGELIDTSHSFSFCCFGLMTDAYVLYFKKNEDAQHFTDRMSGRVKMCPICEEVSTGKTRKLDMLGNSWFKDAEVALGQYGENTSADDIINALLQSEDFIVTRNNSGVCSNCCDDANQICQRLLIKKYEQIKKAKQAEEELLRSVSATKRKRSTSPPSVEEVCPLSANELKAIPPRPSAKLRTSAGSLIDNKKAQSAWDAKYAQYKKWLK